MTHIVSQFNGTVINFKHIFDISKTYGGKIHYGSCEGGHWETQYIENDFITPPIIRGDGNYSYETTVENLASTILIHEWYTHGKLHQGNHNKNHWRAFHNVINFNGIWNRTSNKYKAYNINMFNDYISMEAPFEWSKNLVNNPLFKYYLSK